MAEPKPYIIKPDYPGRDKWNQEIVVIPPNFGGIIMVGRGSQSVASTHSLNIILGEKVIMILPESGGVESKQQQEWCEELLIKICSTVYGVNWELNEKFGL